MTEVDGLAEAQLDQLPGAVAVVDVRTAALAVVFVSQALAELRGTTTQAIQGAGILGLVGDDGQVLLRPEAPQALYMRGFCRYMQGDTEGALTLSRDGVILYANWGGPRF